MCTLRLVSRLLKMNVYLVCKDCMSNSYQVEVVKFKDKKVVDVETKSFKVLDEAIVYAESRENMGRLVTVFVNWKRKGK